MGTEVATRQSFLPAPSEWQQMKETARIVAGTEFVPKGLRGRPEAVLAALLAGREIGVGSMQALQHINVLDGKINYAAELLVAKIRQAGHSLTVEDEDMEADDPYVVVSGRRADNGDQHTVTWTRSMAQKAGLTGKANWQRYERTMLTWRTVTELARFLYPDITMGLMSYTKDELGAEDAPDPVYVGADGEIVEGELIDDGLFPPPDVPGVVEVDGQTVDATTGEVYSDAQVEGESDAGTTSFTLEDEARRVAILDALEIARRHGVDLSEKQVLAQCKRQGLDVADLRALTDAQAERVLEWVDGKVKAVQGD